MRLWHEALIPYLPRQQLLGQHRECCALRGNGWGKKHATVDYVFTHPYGWLVAYHIMVMREMEKRGYHPDPCWKDVRYHGKRHPVSRGYRKTAWAEVWALVEYTKESGDPIYPEHDAAYLQECLDNLAGKGIHIDMGVKKCREKWKK